MSVKTKDTRLWDKGEKTVPFLTHSKKLAVALMETVGIQTDIIYAFKEGEIRRTVALNQFVPTWETISDEDQSVINSLETNGLVVYHVLYFNQILGQQQEFESEYFNLSSYKEIAQIKAYLTVPMDIYKEAITEESDLTKVNRDIIIKQYIEHALTMALHGQLQAYVEDINNPKENRYFSYIGVSQNW